MSPPDRPRTRAATLTDTALFFVASLMGLSFVATGFGYSALGIAVVVVASCLVTAMRFVAGLPSSQRRVVRRLAWLGNVLFHVALLYFAIVWTPRLGWSMPVWSRVLTGALFVGALLTVRRSGVRIPIALPLALMTMMCLDGWNRAEGRVGCDDYLRARAQRGVELLFPSVDGFTSCKPGEVLSVPRYPRKIWESPDGSRYVVTTTPSSEMGSRSAGSGALYDGLFCEVAADGSGRPHCVGSLIGKAHQLEEIAPLDQLFSCVWAVVDGRRTSTIYRLSRGAPLTVLEEHPVEGILAVYGVYQPKVDEYHVFTDQGEAIRSFRATDFSSLPDLPVANSPGATDYDADSDKGVMCGGIDGFTAFTLMPWSYRFLARDGNPFHRLWTTLGCDFDPVGRKVYATVPNFGLVAVIDYDTGYVEQTHFVGFALRSIAFDAVRQRVYIGDFLGGDVLAIDARSGAEIKRWFVGHYIRETLISRDGRALLATSNLGIVRINLESE